MTNLFSVNHSFAWTINFDSVIFVKITKDFFSKVHYKVYLNEIKNVQIRRTIPTFFKELSFELFKHYK